MIFALITRLFQGEAGIFLARLKRLVGLYVMLGVFALLLVIFLITTLFIWLSQHFGSLATALGFSAGALVLVILTYVMVLVAKRKPETRADDRLQRDIASIAGVTALTNAPQIIRAMRQNRSLIAVPVALGGFYGLYRLIAALRGR